MPAKTVGENPAPFQPQSGITPRRFDTGPAIRYGDVEVGQAALSLAFEQYAVERAEAYAPRLLVPSSVQSHVQYAHAVDHRRPEAVAQGDDRLPYREVGSGRVADDDVLENLPVGADGRDGVRRLDPVVCQEIGDDIAGDIVASQPQGCDRHDQRDDQNEKEPDTFTMSPAHADGSVSRVGWLRVVHPAALLRSFRRQGNAKTHTL